VLWVLELGIEEPFLVVGLLQLLLHIADEVLRLPAARILELFGLRFGGIVGWRRRNRDLAGGFDLLFFHGGVNQMDR
jgi:hypothetical protein